MRLTLLFTILCSILLFGCDPKSGQRGARYDAADCPTCKHGECTYCKADGKCIQCKGEKTRVTSTKNYTGEGIKLIDIPEPCPFCKATGVCTYCEGTGKCHVCKGEGKTTLWEPNSAPQKETAVQDTAAPVDSSVTDTAAKAPAADTAAAQLK